MLKDYYKILRIEPSANAREIKAAYRKLALQFHPDKNFNDKYALAQFYLVKEAYETLSTPSLKEEYMKQRWLTKIYAGTFDTATESPEKILLTFLDANAKLRSLDIFRLDKKGIAEEIALMLGANHISLLNDFKETEVNAEIINQALTMTEVLQPAAKEKILSELKKIEGSAQSIQQIKKAEKQLRQQILFNKLQPIFISLIVLFLLGLIWMAGS